MSVDQQAWSHYYPGHRFCPCPHSADEETGSESGDNLAGVTYPRQTLLIQLKNKFWRNKPNVQLVVLTLVKPTG